MRSPRCAQMLTAGITAVIFALTGCSTNTAPLRPSTPTSSKTSTAPTSVTPTAEPAVLAPPTSASNAIVDANNSLMGYYKASFASGHAGGTRLDFVVPWASGPTLRNERLLAKYLVQNRLRLDGMPTAWSLNRTRSVASQTKQIKSGQVVKYGSVTLVGCIESTNRAVGPGAPSWTTKGKRTSIQWSVLYDAGRRQWLVNKSGPVTSGSGQLSCG